MKSIDKLRTAARNMAKGRPLENHEECNLLLIIADEIEAEIADNYMRLPVDADGVPIHVGDDLRSAFSKTEYKALGFWFDFDCGIWQVMVSSEQAMSGNILRHVKPRTLEDVLEDYVVEYQTRKARSDFGSESFDRVDVHEMIKRCAAEIRELLGDDAE